MPQTNFSDSARAFKLLADTTAVALTRIDNALAEVRRAEEEHHLAADKAYSALLADGRAVSARVDSLTSNLTRFEMDCRARHPLNAFAASRVGATPRFWWGINARFLIICGLIALALLALIFNASNLGEFAGTLLARVIGH